MLILFAINRNLFIPFMPWIIRRAIIDTAPTNPSGMEMQDASDSLSFWSFESSIKIRGVTTKHMDIRLFSHISKYISRIHRLELDQINIFTSKQ